MKKIIVFSWFCLLMFVVSNTCVAQSEIPICKKVNFETLMAEINKMEPQLMVKNIECRETENFTMYKFFLSDKLSMINFLVVEDNVMDISLITSNKYKPAFETLMSVLKNVGVTRNGLQNIHDSMVKSFNNKKEVVFDRTDKKFVVNAFPAGVNALFVGIKCYKIE